jgi:hypothetical protein
MAKSSALQDESTILSKYVQESPVKSIRDPQKLCYFASFPVLACSRADIVITSLVLVFGYPRPMPAVLQISIYSYPIHCDFWTSTSDANLDFSRLWGLQLSR